MIKRGYIIGAAILLVVLLGVVVYNSRQSVENTDVKESNRETNDNYHSGMEKKEAYEESVQWEEITESGVNETVLEKNLDANILAIIEQSLQAILAKNSGENALSGSLDWIFESNEYNEIIKLGDKAQKPLFWLIYKTDDSGMSEYICARALSEISGIGTPGENRGLEWSNSKEYVEYFISIIKEKNKE